MAITYWMYKKVKDHILNLSKGLKDGSMIEYSCLQAKFGYCYSELEDIMHIMKEHGIVKAIHEHWITNNEQIKQVNWIKLSHDTYKLILLNCKLENVLTYSNKCLIITRYEKITDFAYEYIFISTLEFEALKEYVEPFIKEDV